jgi:DNA-binding transcriptional regulator YiaG
MNSNELYWLAGILEGEGSFGCTVSSPTIRVGMTDRDVMNRVAELLDARVGKSKRLPPQKTMYVVSLSGDKALDLMRLVRPLMGQRRGGRIDSILTWANKRPGYSYGKKRAKLDIAQARQIRSEYQTGDVSQPQLARRYGVSQSSIGRIIYGHTWRERPNAMAKNIRSSSGLGHRGKS